MVDHRSTIIGKFALFSQSGVVHKQCICTKGGLLDR